MALTNPSVSSVPMDFLADANGAELARLSQLYAFPDYVKQAGQDETLKPASLPTSVMADPRDGFRRFPCHTKAATWLSLMFFQEKKASYQSKEAARVEQRLEHFAKYWGIKSAFDTIKTRHAQLYKNADDQLPDSDFAYVWVGDNGVKERHLRIKNAGEVKAAAGWLNEHRDAMPYTDRNIIALRILEKAARYGAAVGEELDGFLERQAGRGVCVPQEVGTMIRNRAKLARDNEFRAGIEKLAQMVETRPGSCLHPEMLVKLAATVDDLDRKLGIVGKYTDVLKRPEDVLFKSTYKEVQAGVNGSCVLTTNRIFDKADFGKLALDDLKSLLGSDFSASVADGLKVDTEKLAEQVSVLPRPDAELFEQLLEEIGVRPIHTKNAGDRYGLRDVAVAPMFAGKY